MTDEQDEILAFREANSAALNDAGHPEHSTAVESLRGLYVAKFPEPERIDVPARNDASEAPAVGSEPLRSDELDNETTTEMREWMTRPDTPDGYEFKRTAVPETIKVGDGSESVPLEMDLEREQVARDWMFDASISKADGLALQSSYLEEVLNGFTDTRAQELTDQCERMLTAEYGDQKPAMLAGARKLIQALDKERPGLIDFLETTNMGNHPRMVQIAIKAAKARGFIEG